MSTPTKQDREDFRGYCEQVTVDQLRNVHAKEKAANRIVYSRIAQEVLSEREASDDSSPRQRG